MEQTAEKPSAQTIEKKAAQMIENSSVLDILILCFVAAIVAKTEQDIDKSTLDKLLVFLRFVLIIFALLSICLNPISLLLLLFFCLFCQTFE